MDVWTTLGRWAEKRLNSLTITLVEAPAEFFGYIGQMAWLESPGAKACGPLTLASFWSPDWGAALGDATAAAPPEAGRLVEWGGRRYYVSALSYERSALVLGGGHVGGALGRLLRFLEFEVTLMDDRSDFLRGWEGEGVTAAAAPFDRLTELFSEAAFKAVIIVTRGHAQDTGCLRQILSWAQIPPYLGMIGSRRRTRETIEMLTKEGFLPDLLGRVHTPVGLKIGAQTPAEIAVSIAAEIIMVLNGGVSDI